jgi:hypothetical protein
MNTNQKFFDTKTIILNLLKEDNEMFISIERLQNLLSYIYIELRKKRILDQYDILFDINFEAIERTVVYNNNIFFLDIDGDKIYLRENQDLTVLTEQYEVDDTVCEIIKDFKSLVANTENIYV